MKKVILFTLTLILLMGPVLTAYSETTSPQPDYGSMREGPSEGAVVVDALIARPMGIVALASGLVISVVALPLGLAGGSAPTVYQRLIKEPFDFTFRRPMGRYGEAMPSGY
jgi:hypothetical protein